MQLKRIDHIGINVNDLPAAKAFFVDFGLRMEMEWESEGEWLDEVVGLRGVRTEAAMMALPDSQTKLELIKYHAPVDGEGIQPRDANALGIRHVAMVVDDLEAVVARLKARGMDTFSPIQTYEGMYKLIYCRGPEGIILELAEEINKPWA